MNPDQITQPTEVANSNSALRGPNKNKVESQILTELEHGHYLKTDHKPTIISAISAISKKNTDNIRLIHDCSRPIGKAVNDFAPSDTFRFETIQDAASLVGKQYFMAKIDLSNAYRSVKIHPSNFKATGLQWIFEGDTKPTYLTDTRLMFGSSRAPYIFNKLSQAVKCIMASKGYRNIKVYLDDYFICESSFDQCLRTLNALLRILRQLGFQINYNKVVGPTQRLTYLGLSLCSISMTIEVPNEKLDEIRTILSKTCTSKYITKVQLQSLVGKLNFIQQAIYGGRVYLRRLIDRIHKLNRPWHKSRVTCDMRADIEWWLHFMDIFNGTISIQNDRASQSLAIDSCNMAGGAFFGGDWMYVPWNQPEVANLHINFKEVLVLEPAVHKWGHLWSNQTIYVHSDNQCAVSIINKGTSSNPFIMSSLRRIFWASAIYNFRLRAVYYRGVHNKLADSISRLHEPNGLDRFTHILASTYY